MQIRENEELIIFKNEWKKDDRVTCTYSTSISRKNKDGNYTRMTLAVVLMGDLKKDFDEHMKAYEYVKVQVLDGFISFDEYTDKSGAPAKKITVCLKQLKLVEKKEMTRGTGEKIQAAEVKYDSSSLF